MFSFHLRISAVARSRIYYDLVNAMFGRKCTTWAVSTLDLVVCCYVTSYPWIHLASSYTTVAHSVRQLMCHHHMCNQPLKQSVVQLPANTLVSTSFCMLDVRTTPQLSQLASSLTHTSCDLCRLYIFLHTFSAHFTLYSLYGIFIINHKYIHPTKKKKKNDLGKTYQRVPNRADRWKVSFPQPIIQITTYSDMFLVTIKSRKPKP